jgi:hypothetical protein
LTPTTPETSVPLSVPLGGKTDIMKIPQKFIIFGATKPISRELDRV